MTKFNIFDREAALSSPGGAMMRPGALPVAYWINGDGTRRTFYGVTREHAFQRALRWGRDSAPATISERRPPRSPGGITPSTPEDLSR